ncbi:hypothetical protein [Capnocytophaga granulosa]|uniref:hypothetical protein n=1 Tax=Capnocytophaga granulosa TaxID=45242 RepID=UPI0023EFA2B8|nr:hypothetical protein [Capnocytophaga granulosa]
MKNIAYRVVRYFLYSILFVVISKFVFSIPIFYLLTIENFREKIPCESTDVISCIVFFVLLLLLEQKNRDSYGFYALFYACFHLLSAMIFVIYQYMKLSLVMAEEEESHIWNNFLLYKEDMIQLFLRRSLDTGILSVYIVSSFFILKRYVSGKL